MQIKLSSIANARREVESNQFIPVELLIPQWCRLTGSYENLPNTTRQGYGFSEICGMKVKALEEIKAGEFFIVDTTGYKYRFEFETGKKIEFRNDYFERLNRLKLIED